MPKKILKQWEKSKRIETITSEIQVSKKGLFKKTYQYKTITTEVECRTNSIGMEFVLNPHWDFYIGRYPVTLSQFYKIIGTDSLNDEAKEIIKIHPKKPVAYDSNGWKIIFNQVQYFIKKLNELENCLLYRLPTKKEWQHSCRAGGKFKLCYGDDEVKLGEYAWYKKNALDVGITSFKVGMKKPNRWGIYDMHGGVFELWDIGDYWKKRDSNWYMQINNMSAGAWGVEAKWCASRYGVQQLPIGKEKSGVINYKSSGNVGFRLVREMEDNTEFNY